MNKEELVKQNEELNKELDFIRNLLKEVYGFHWVGVDPETRAFVRKQVKDALKGACNICGGSGKLPCIGGSSKIKCPFCYNVG